jgi:hypothetical protein
LDESLKIKGVMAIKAVKMLDVKFYIPLKLNDLKTSDVVG